MRVLYFSYKKVNDTDYRPRFVLTEKLATNGVIKGLDLEDNKYKTFRVDRMHMYDKFLRGSPYTVVLDNVDSVEMFSQDSLEKSLGKYLSAILPGSQIKYYLNDLTQKKVSGFTTDCKKPVWFAYLDSPKSLTTTQNSDVLNLYVVNNSNFIKFKQEGLEFYSNDKKVTYKEFASKLLNK